MKRFLSIVAAAFILSIGAAVVCNAAEKKDAAGAATSATGSASTATKGAATKIDSAAATAESSTKAAGAKVGAAKSAAKVEKVDINSATEDQLKSIPGVGDTYAKKIIAGRPYANKSQLKSKKIVPDSVYSKIADLIVAKQPAKK